MSDDSLIVNVIRRYFPDWEPPKQGRNKWTSCRCPFHGDSSPSASISLELNAFNCFVCGVKGDAIKIIREREEVTFGEAKRIAEGVSPGSYGAVPDKLPKKPSRRVFGDTGPGDIISSGPSRDRPVPTRVRRRTFGGP